MGGRGGKDGSEGEVSQGWGLEVGFGRWLNRSSVSSWIMLSAAPGDSFSIAKQGFWSTNAPFRWHQSILHLPVAPGRPKRPVRPTRCR